MKYVKEENTLNIPEDFEQSFFKSPYITTDLTATVMLKSKGIVDNVDIKILYFLYETKFCTKDQIRRWAKYEGIEDDELFDRLNMMFSNTIINKFGFVDEKNYKGQLPPDIKVFYCLHDGGKHLLDNFSGDDFIDWQAGYNVTHTKNVIKALVSAELYTQLYTSGAELVFHTRRPLFIIHVDRFFGGDTFCIRKDNETHYYICDTFLSSDRTSLVRNKLLNYESVVTTKIWRRNYRDYGTTPHLIFVTDDDNSAAILAGEIGELKCNDFLVSTKDRLLSGIGTNGSFLAFNKESNELYPTSLI